MDSPPDLTATGMVADTTPAFPTQGADFGIRVLARLIDLTYILGLGFGTGIFLGAVLAILSNLEKAPEDWAERIEGAGSLGIGLLAAFAYQVISEAIGSASLGKTICGLRVVRADGAPCTFGGALLRGIAYHFDALFFGLVGYTSMKTTELRQRYGDKWGDTVVVKAATFQSAPPRTALHLALGILTGTAAWVVIVGGDLWLHVYR